MRHAMLCFLVVLFCFQGCSEPPVVTKLKPGITFEVYSVAAEQGDATKPLTDPDSGEVLHLVSPAIITAANVQSATANTDESNTVILKVTLNKPGEARMSAATAVAGGRLAIVVDGKIVSAPVCHARIGDKFQITGEYSAADWQKVLQ